MGENKMDNITFGTEEKEILEILAAFENELGGLPESASVEYYENFEIKGMKDSEISGVFLLTKQDEKGEIIGYSLYYQSPSDEILSVDKDGNVQINSKWKEVIGDINFEKTKNINDEKENVKGISRNVEPEEIQQRREEKKDENKEIEKEEQEEKEKPEEQIQRDLGEDTDLEISYYRPIKDVNFDKQIGMNLSGYKEIGLAYSKAENSFIMVGKNNEGKFEQIDGIEKAQPTYKTVMSIDEKGKSVEKEVPHALMKTNDDDKELSITIGQYGYIEVGTVDRLPCAERVKRQVGEQGEGEQGRTSAQINKAIEHEGRVGLHEWAHKNEETIEPPEDKIRKDDIAEEIEGNTTEPISNDLASILEEYGVTEIGNTEMEIHTIADFEALIEKEAGRANVSIEGFKEDYLKNASGKSLEEKIDSAHEQIYRDSIGDSSRPR